MVNAILLFSITVTLLVALATATFAIQYAYPDNTIIITNSSFPVFVEPSICTSSLTGDNDNNIQLVDCSGEFIQVRKGMLVTELLQETQRLQGIIDSFADSLMRLMLNVSGAG